MKVWQLQAPTVQVQLNEDGSMHIHYWRSHWGKPIYPTSKRAEPGTLFDPTAWKNGHLGHTGWGFNHPPDYIVPADNIEWRRAVIVEMIHCDAFLEHTRGEKIALGEQLMDNSEGSVFEIGQAEIDLLNADLPEDLQWPGPGWYYQWVFGEHNFGPFKSRNEAYLDIYAEDGSPQTMPPTVKVCDIPWANVSPTWELPEDWTPALSKE